MEGKQKPIIDCNKDVGVQRNLLLDEIIDDVLNGVTAGCVCGICNLRGQFAEYLRGKKSH